MLNLHYLPWETMYKMIKKMSVDCKTREFQFKLLHNILYTNERLHRLNPVKFPTPMCTFCQNNFENIEHLFYNCQYTKALWRDLLFCWGQPLKLQQPPSKQCLILSDPNETLLVNFIGLLARRYIYYSKMNDKKPNFQGLIPYIKRVYQIEYFIAYKNNKMGLHFKKWSPILQYVR